MRLAGDKPRVLYKLKPRSGGSPSFTRICQSQPSRQPQRHEGPATPYRLVGANIEVMLRCDDPDFAACISFGLFPPPPWAPVLGRLPLLEAEH